jgi:hypothetical protein
MTFKRYLLIVGGGFVAITTIVIATGSDPAALRQQRLSECSAMMRNRLLASGSPERATRMAGELCRIREEGLN